MKTVAVRKIIIGEGKPKICIPIVGTTRKGILEEARELKRLPADMAEWRADWYEDVFEPGQVLETAGCLREVLGELPLLFTFRTKKEGGEKEISVRDYTDLNKSAARSGFIDLTDVELFTYSSEDHGSSLSIDGGASREAGGFAGENALSRLIEDLHQERVKVIVSSHDFSRTPPQKELFARLAAMEQAGADILKIAVMPRSRRDVLDLLAVTLEMGESCQCPLITMSMSSAGMVSRLTGEIFGSAVTFGAAGKASAPGQIGAAELAGILDIIHHYGV